MDYEWLAVGVWQRSENRNIDRGTIGDEHAANQDLPDQGSRWRGGLPAHREVADQLDVWGAAHRAILRHRPQSPKQYLHLDSRRSTGTSAKSGWLVGVLFLRFLGPADQYFI